MKERLMRRGIDGNHIHVAENWADALAIQPLRTPGQQTPLTVRYSGNLGLAHDIDTISEAMLNLRGDDSFYFVFVGGGGRSKELAKFCTLNNISAIDFRPYAQRSNLSESLSVGDISLVTQRNDCCGFVVSSKVYGLLTAGRTILFIGPGEATPARIIERLACGWHIACGNTVSFTALFERLADKPHEVQEAGRRARQAAVDHYDRSLGVARIAGILGVCPASSVAAERAGVFNQTKHRSTAVSFLSQTRTTEKRV